MPNFKSDLITAKDGTGNLSNRVIDGDRTGGILLLATAIYTLLGTEAGNDTIELCDIPPGAVIVPQLCHVTGADPGTTLTLDIGDADNPDGLADGIVLSAGGQVAFCSGTLPAEATAPVRAGNTGRRILATVASADTLTPGVKLAFTIAFRAKA